MHLSHSCSPHIRRRYPSWTSCQRLSLTQTLSGHPSPGYASPSLKLPRSCRVQKYSDSGDRHHDTDTAQLIPAPFTNTSHVMPSPSQTLPRSCHPHHKPCPGHVTPIINAAQVMPPHLINPAPVMPPHLTNPTQVTPPHLKNGCPGHTSPHHKHCPGHPGSWPSSFFQGEEYIYHPWVTLSNLMPQSNFCWYN